jgi:hypothetical protein
MFLNQVSSFLGLGQFDFLPTVSQGRYNVEGNEGYEKMTSWEVRARLRISPTRALHLKQ